MPLIVTDAGLGLFFKCSQGQGSTSHRCSGGMVGGVRWLLQALWGLFIGVGRMLFLCGLGPFQGQPGSRLLWFETTGDDCECGGLFLDPWCLSVWVWSQDVPPGSRVQRAGSSACNSRHSPLSPFLYNVI